VVKYSRGIDIYFNVLFVGGMHMKTAIIYYSKHHGNTKKLLDAIVETNPDIQLIDITEKHEVNLCKYDRIGIASGIYFGKFAKQILTFAKINLPEYSKVFFVYTYGSADKKTYTKEIKKIVKDLYCDIVGEFGCPGFDDFGPLKLFGGLQKEHPTVDEINSAVEFYEKVKETTNALITKRKLRKKLELGTCN